MEDSKCKVCKIRYSTNNGLCVVCSKQQLCWTCQNAVGKCSWSRDFIPVSGWKAVKKIRRFVDYDRQKRKKVNDELGYRISECPLYKPDWITDHSNSTNMQGGA